MPSMPKVSTHTHPNPRKDRLTQYGAVGLVVLMLLAVPALILLTLLGAPGGLFVLAGLVVLLLALPVLMVTATSPAVTLDDDGVTLHPVVWRERHIPWEAVTAVKDYPLLPTESGEVNRRNFVGRRNYTAAEGIMLIVPSLPPQYHIVGFFAGEPGRGVIALTNRTHTDYTQLKRVVVRHKGKIQPHA
jgi:hypothetical protein